MTILDFVLSQRVMNINEWVKVIEDNGLSKYQHTIIECANDYNMVTVNGRPGYTMQPSSNL